MNKNLNCPNCGAPITGFKCEYCGTQFYNFADIDLYKPCYARVKLDNRIVFVKFFPYLLEIHNEYMGYDGTLRTPNGTLSPVQRFVNTTFTLEGTLLPLED